MGGFFGNIEVKDCVNDLFYGTDYNSHLGTKRAGLVTFDKEKGFTRSIHSLERDYFRSRFESELEKFAGKSGIGVISDTDPQPILINSHLGRFAVVTVAKINNTREIAKELNSPNFGLVFDPANYSVAGEDVIVAEKNMHDYITYIHVKDYSIKKVLEVS